MVTKIDFINELKKILNPKIGYCPINKKYYLDEIWDTDISSDYFDELTYNFEKNLLNNLSNFNSPKEIIQEFYEIIWEKIEWYTRNEINKFSFLNVIKRRIFEFENLNPIRLEDKITIENARNFDFEKENIDGNDLLSVIWLYREETNNFIVEKDFEKIKLLNALQIHFGSLNLFYDSLYKIEMNFEDLNILAIASNQSYSKLNKNSLKCNIDLDKLGTAVLFRFLLDTNLFFMDSEANKNKVKTQNFFEANFNYTSNDGISYPISRLNNDLVKISFDNKLDKQLDTLENLINSLTRYKKKIEEKYPKKKSP